MKQEWDKLPVTVETTSFRKTSDDYTFTIVTQRKYEELAKAFMGRISSMGVLFFVPCTPDQVDALLRDSDAPPAAIESPAPEGQDKFFVPLDLMAQVLGVDPRTVQLDAEKGLLVRTGRGQYDTLASCGTLRKALREAESGKNDAYNDERTASMRLRRQERELNYHERAGNLVNAAAVRSVIEKAKAAEKQQVLFMPKQLAPRLEGDPAVNETILEEWAYAFLKGQTEINITADISPDAGKPGHESVDRMPEMKKRKKRKKGKK